MSATGSGATVKAEAQTEEELRQEKINNLYAEGKATLAKFQRILTELKFIKNAAAERPYTDEFVKDVAKLVDKVGKSCKMLEVIAVGSADRNPNGANTKKVDVLLVVLEKLEGDYTSMLEHAKRFGLSCGKARSGKRKRN